MFDTVSTLPREDALEFILGYGFVNFGFHLKRDSEERYVSGLEFVDTIRHECRHDGFVKFRYDTKGDFRRVTVLWMGKETDAVDEPVKLMDEFAQTLGAAKRYWYKHFKGNEAKGIEDCVFLYVNISAEIADEPFTWNQHSDNFAESRNCRFFPVSEEVVELLFKHHDYTDDTPMLWTIDQNDDMIIDTRKRHLLGGNDA